MKETDKNGRQNELKGHTRLLATTRMRQSRHEEFTPEVQARRRARTNDVSHGPAALIAGIPK